MKILIGGGSGFIGRNLHKALLQRGHTALIISRTPGKDKITWRELQNEKSLPEETDGVVNLCGEYILNTFRRWNDAYKKDVYESRCGTNQILVKLITEGTVKPHVWISGHAEGYYPRDSEEYDETFTLNTQPQTFMQKLCVEWEKSAKLPDNENIRHVAIRTGLVLGKDGGLIQQSYWPFYFGVGGAVGSGNQPFPWIHIKDLVNMFIHALENENVSGVLNGVAPQDCSNTDFTKAFGSALNRPTFIPVPEFAINFFAGSDRAPLLLSSPKVIPKRVLESGFQYEFTDIKTCMKDIVS